MTPYILGVYTVLPEKNQKNQDTPKKEKKKS